MTALFALPLLALGASAATLERPVEAPRLIEFPVLAPLPVLSPASPLPEAHPAAEARLAAMSAALAPHLEAAASPSASPSSLRETAARLIEPMSAAWGVGSRPEAPSGPGGGASFGAGGGGNGGRGGGRGSRSRPLLTGVAYAEGIEEGHRGLFHETLVRRKAAWTKGLAQSGLSVEAPPALTVREARDLVPGASKTPTYTRFTVDWKRSETQLGAFSVTVRLKDLRIEFREAAPILPPESRQLKIRFLKTRLQKVGEAWVETAVTRVDIARFLEERRLRLLWGSDYQGYTVAVTGQDEAEAVSAALTGSGLVLFARPVSEVIPPHEQIRIAFKAKTVVDAGILMEIAVTEERIASFFAAYNLRVVEAGRDGLWTVAGRKGSDPAGVLGELRDERYVLYASALEAGAPEAHQAVVRFRRSRVVDIGGVAVESDVTQDDVAAVFTRRRLTVLADLGSGYYRVASAEPVGDAFLASEGAIVKASPIGSVPEEMVRAQAASAAHYKGGLYSATEFSIHTHEHRIALERSGASRAQLALFDKLLAEAPVSGGRYNSYGGD